MKNSDMLRSNLMTEKKHQQHPKTKQKEKEKKQTQFNN